MESFLVAVRVVYPLVIYMLIGWFIRKRNIMTKEHLKNLNATVFKVILPIGIFFDIYQTDIGEVFQPQVFLFVFLGIILLFSASCLVVSRIIKDYRDSTVVIQGIYRSNYALFGASIAKAVCGSEGVALVAALTAIVIPTINILAVILFESKRGGKIKVSRVFMNILKNPLVVAGVSGALAALVGLEIPDIVSQPFITFGDTAAPLALVALGGMISVKSVMNHKNYLTLTVIGRLICSPILMLSAAILFGMRGEVLIAILAVFGSPTAVSSAPMAQAMGGNGELAGEIVAITSVCSIVTVFSFVFALSRFGFL